MTSAKSVMPLHVCACEVVSINAMDTTLHEEHQLVPSAAMMRQDMA